MSNPYRDLEQRVSVLEAHVEVSHKHHSSLDVESSLQAEKNRAILAWLENIVERLERLEAKR